MKFVYIYKSHTKFLEFFNHFLIYLGALNDALHAQIMVQCDRQFSALCSLWKLRAVPSQDASLFFSFLTLIHETQTTL